MLGIMIIARHVACWATFAEFDGPDIQHEGFATRDDYAHGADYDWTCLSCFADLKDEMKWIEIIEGLP